MSKCSKVSEGARAPSATSKNDLYGYERPREAGQAPVEGRVTVVTARDRHPTHGSVRRRSRAACHVACSCSMAWLDATVNQLHLRSLIQRFEASFGYKYLPLLRPGKCY